MDEPRSRIALVLAAALNDVAADRGCGAHELSVGVFRALESRLLEAFRLGGEFERERRTPAVKAPEGVWDDDVTPVYPYRER